MIIGTERHESRRIDNQLRGRSGRQGDPGESKFYISLEDDLMRLFGSERLINMFNALGIPENQEIEHKALTNAIEVLRELVAGESDAAIAEKLFMSLRTVKSHIQSMREKTGFRNRTELAVRARESGLIINDK